MNNSNVLPSKPRRTPAWLKTVWALLFIAMSGASYLAWVSLHDGHAAGCGAESGCNAVLQSRWAYWFGLPVSIPAVLVYIALLGSTILLPKSAGPDEERGSWAAITILSVVVAGSAFWFVSLQVFVIHSFCKYCLTAHACGIMAALLCLANIPCAADPDTPMWAAGSGKRGVPRKAVLSLVVAGLAGVSVLVAGQLLVQKERNVVKVLATQAPGTNLPDRSAEMAPASPNARIIAPRTLSLYSNQFIIKFNEVPLMGSPDAPHIIVCLYDYTCVHCRALYPILEQVSQQFSNQLGMVCLPASLAPQCNPFIPKVNSMANPDACDYARLGLAVWRARPDLQRQFNHWMFAPPKPPPVDQVRDYAASLVGAEKLKTALADPWVSQQLLTDCKIHRANWLAVDNSGMPQIVLGNAVSSGPINSIEHLQILLRQYLGLNLQTKGM